MSYTLHSHVKSDKAKWWIAGIAIVLILAILGWLIFAAVKDINPVCLFKHNYGEDGICSRCGQEKPAEEEPADPDNSEEQPQLTTVAYASALAATSDSGLEPLLQDGSENSYMAKKSAANFNSCKDFDDTVPAAYIGFFRNIAINMSRPTKSVIDIDKDSEFSVGLLTATTGYHYITIVKKLGWTDWKSVGGYFWQNGGDIYEVGQYTISEYGIYQVAVLYSGAELRSDIVTVRYGVTELPAAPSKTGYTFTGWYTDEACTNLYTEEYVTSDITLYAGFKPITYHLNFMGQGGDGSMDDMDCTYDVEYTLPKCTFVRENYRFVGWAIDDDSDEAVVGLTDGQVFKNLSADDDYWIDLFAIWELNAVEVKFDIDGVITSKMTVIGQAAELPEDPSKTGYIFVGWYTSNGELYNGEAITEACTLTARFEIIRCTVTFIVDGEVYAHYVCDYGTSISEALRASEVNTLLYKADEHSANF